jgi:hypothetical protein
MQKENDREIHNECFRRAGFGRDAESCGRSQGRQLLPQRRVLQERRSLLQEVRGQEGRLLPQWRMLQERELLQENAAVLTA